MTMQIFFFGLILCLANQVRGQGPMVEVCQKELNYTGDFKKIDAGASQEDKCFISCIYTKNGEIKEDGSLDLDKTKEVIFKCPKSTPEQKEKYFQAAKECASEVSTSSEKCEPVFKYHMCRMGKLKVK